MWVFIGLLMGSLIISQHDSEEACKGRKAMMQDRKDAPVYGQCVHIDQITVGTTSTIGVVRNGIWTMPVQ